MSKTDKQVTNRSHESAKKKKKKDAKHNQVSRKFRVAAKTMYAGLDTFGPKLAFINLTSNKRKKGHRMDLI